MSFVGCGQRAGVFTAMAARCNIPFRRVLGLTRGQSMSENIFAALRLLVFIYAGSFALFGRGRESFFFSFFFLFPSLLSSDRNGIHQV